MLGTQRDLCLGRAYSVFGRGRRAYSAVACSPRQDEEMSPDALRAYAHELRQIAAEFEHNKLEERSAAELRVQAAILRAAAAHDASAKALTAVATIKASATKMARQDSATIHPHWGSPGYVTCPPENGFKK